MKKTLFLYYSQAGQADRAMRGLAQAFGDHADIVRFETDEAFQFPWSMTGFFRAFPRCVLGLAPRFKEPEIRWDDYDLIVLGFQVWFLSPSLPFQSFLQSKAAEHLHGKPVLTVLTCRNLWYSASRLVRERLVELGADVLGQLTLCERSPLWASFVTTPRWMLTGRQNGFGIFPPAGIREEDFAALEEKGRLLAQSWGNGRTLPSDWTGSNLDRVSLRLMDRIGRKFFGFWAPLIVRLAPRQGRWQDFLLILFRINLIALILSVGPCTKVIELLVGNDSKKIQLQS